MVWRGASEVTHRATVMYGEGEQRGTESVCHHGGEQGESPGNSIESSQPPCFPRFIFHHTGQGAIPALPWAKHELFLRV